MCFFASICISIAAEEKGRRWDACIFVCGMASGILFTIGILNDSPKPIDVYRNKTTLEITYKDGVATDTVVVFKDKKK